ncbi:MAG: cytochrome c [Elusimicrobia bacterium]|nr:cytochrome c [Elusimicrobiota bacterium]
MAGKQMTQLSKKELRGKIKSQTEKFFDPRYGKVKSYHCLPIKEVMNLAYGPGWEKSSYTEAVLTALDGYASVTTAQKLTENGGCLAIEDTEFPNWEPVGRKRANPGPFYLSWLGESQSTENEYPWPYQLASINLVKFEDRYPEVVPNGAPKDSSAYRGYNIFKGQCMRCHAMNQQGGRIGPDLNAPQSITAYRSKDMIKAFVRQPSKFRYTEMPDHTHLSDSDLEDLYQYLLFKSKQPEKKPF